MTTWPSSIVSSVEYYALCLSIIELMSSKRRFRNKQPTATPPDPVNCKWDTCMQQFSCITDLVQHIKKTHILKGIMKNNVCLWRNCPMNKKSFNNHCRLVTHLQSHTKEKPHKCPVSSPTVTTCFN